MTKRWPWATSRRVEQIDLGDHFVFSVERAPSDEDEGRGIRFRVRSELAGDLFEVVSVDVGFSDALIGNAELVGTPGLLDFADIAAIEVPVVPLEQQVAEKVHAYTRTYRGHRSSRTKDLVDIVLVSRHLSVNGRRLAVALELVFAARSTHDLPKALPAPPAEWMRPYAALARTVGLPVTLAEGFTEAASLLNPILSGAAAGDWEPNSRAWNA